MTPGQLLKLASVIAAVCLIFPVGSLSFWEALPWFLPGIMFNIGLWRYTREALK